METFTSFSEQNKTQFRNDQRYFLPRSTESDSSLNPQVRGKYVPTYPGRLEPSSNTNLKSLYSDNDQYEKSRNFLSQPNKYGGQNENDSSSGSVKRYTAQSLTHIRKAPTRTAAGNQLPLNPDNSHRRREMTRGMKYEEGRSGSGRPEERGRNDGYDERGKSTEYKRGRNDEGRNEEERDGEGRDGEERYREERDDYDRRGEYDEENEYKENHNYQKRDEDNRRSEDNRRGEHDKRSKDNRRINPRERDYHEKREEYRKEERYGAEQRLNGYEKERSNIYQSEGRYQEKKHFIDTSTSEYVSSQPIAGDIKLSILESLENNATTPTGSSINAAPTPARFKYSPLTAMLNNLVTITPSNRTNETRGPLSPKISKTIHSSGTIHIDLTTADDQLKRTHQTLKRKIIEITSQSSSDKERMEAFHRVFHPFEIPTVMKIYHDDFTVLSNPEPHTDIQYVTPFRGKIEEINETSKIKATIEETGPMFSAKVSPGSKREETTLDIASWGSSSILDSIVERETVAIDGKNETMTQDSSKLKETSSHDKGPTSPIVISFVPQDQQFSDLSFNTKNQLENVESSIPFKINLDQLANIKAVDNEPINNKIRIENANETNQSDIEEFVGELTASTEVNKFEERLDESNETTEKATVVREEREEVKENSSVVEKKKSKGESNEENKGESKEEGNEENKGETTESENREIDNTQVSMVKKEKDSFEESGDGNDQEQGRANDYSTASDGNKANLKVTNIQPSNIETFASNENSILSENLTPIKSHPITNLNVSSPLSLPLGSHLSNILPVIPSSLNLNLRLNQNTMGIRANSVGTRANSVGTRASSVGNTMVQSLSTIQSQHQTLVPIGSKPILNQSAPSVPSYQQIPGVGAVGMSSTLVPINITPLQPAPGNLGFPPLANSFSPSNLTPSNLGLSREYR